MNKVSGTIAKLKDKIKGQKSHISKLKSRYKTIFNNVASPIIIWGKNYRIKDWNDYAEKLFGWSEREIIGKNLLDILIITEERYFVESLLIKTFDNFKTRAIKKNNTKNKDIICCEWCNIPIVDLNGKVVEVVSIINEVFSSKKESNDLVYYDPLTGIYNRRFYEEELRRLDSKRQLPLSIILGDVNRLKLANDIFGHQHGDELLKEIAEIINYCTRSEDIIARWGGDEFGILLPQTSFKETKKIISRIKNKCQDSKLKPILPDISLGAATKKSDKTDIKDVFKKAENRMYEDKGQEKLQSEGRVLNNLLEYLESKLKGTNLHTDKVIELSKKMGEKLDLDEYELEKLILLAKYHDIGKVGVSKEILNKKTTLTNEEWKQYLRHLQLGYDIAKSFSTLTPIAEEILYHHEAWNGTGYPQQLSEEEIPFLSRIVYIVSYYYELISNVDCGMKININCNLNYRKKDALEKINNYAGRLFDPNLVKVFLEISAY